MTWLKVSATKRHSDCGPNTSPIGLAIWQDVDSPFLNPAAIDPSKTENTELFILLMQSFPLSATDRIFDIVSRVIACGSLNSLSNRPGLSVISGSFKCAYLFIRYLELSNHMIATVGNVGY
jgi:hypothetical protein